MVVENLKGKRVFLDTTPVIYFMEGSPLYKDVLFRIFDANDKGLFSLITSTITLLEVLVMPIRTGRKYIEEKYKTLPVLVRVCNAYQHKMDEVVKRLQIGYPAHVHVCNADESKKLTSTLQNNSLP